jgi:hypothetical protein
MAIFRCPKHDVLFEANQPPTHMGHAKCPHCNPKSGPAENDQVGDGKNKGKD